LNQFLGYNDFSNIDIKRFDKSIIKEYIRWLFQRELKPKSIKRKVAVLKTLFNFLEFEEYIDISPFHKMKIAIKEPISLPKTILIKDIRKLLKHIYKIKNSYTNIDRYSYIALVRDILIIELLFSTGMRVAEICSIKIDDIENFNDIKINGKGSKQRYVYLFSTEIKALLKEYIDINSNSIYSSGWLFVNRLGNKLSEQSVRNMIKKYQHQANIDTSMTPHMFRHSFATMLLEEGVDIRYIQHILGHSSISTTQIYTQVNKKASKKILSAKHPRNSLNVVDVI
jgi:integrase/recombinase XerD